MPGPIRDPPSYESGWLFVLVGGTAALSASLSCLMVAAGSGLLFVFVLAAAIFAARSRSFVVLHAGFGILTAAGLIVLSGTAGGHVFSIVMHPHAGMTILRIRAAHLVTARSFFLFCTLLWGGRRALSCGLRPGNDREGKDQS
jgi:hypothetical protein